MSARPFKKKPDGFTGPATRHSTCSSAASRHVMQQGHWGLISMRERAANLKAKLSIRSNNGSGTLVRQWRDSKTRAAHGPLMRRMAQKLSC